jgi:hypothetical protein
MRIRSLFFVLFLPVAVPACGPSVTQACDDYTVVWCNRQYACDTGATLAALTATYGATAQQCAATRANLVNENCTAAQSTCPPGTSYDTGLAEKCVSDTNKQSCADVSAEATPPSCLPSALCH